MGKEYFCRTCEAHGVKTSIFFMNSNKSSKGTMIPIETVTKQNHNCPFRQPASSTPVVQPTVAPKSEVPKTTPQVSEIAVLTAQFKALTEQLNRIEQAIAGLLMTHYENLEAKGVSVYEGEDTG